MSVTKISSVVEFKSNQDSYVDYIIRVSYEPPADEHDRIYSVACEVWKVADWGDESGASEDCWRVCGSQTGFTEPSTNLDEHQCHWGFRLKWDGCSNWTHNTDHYCDGLDGLLRQQAVDRECFRLAFEVMAGSYAGS